jgi:hypothetical protein
MRPDMHKVIIGRPRYSSRTAASPKLRKDRGAEAERRSIGLRRHVDLQHHYGKGQSDHLGPLVRYLWKQRGRPWNKVFSELCAGSNTGSILRRHLREHVEHLVMLELSRGRHGEWIYRGKPIASDPRFHVPPLYVDPRDGLLKDSKPFLRKVARSRAQPS